MHELGQKRTSCLGMACPPVPRCRAWIRRAGCPLLAHSGQNQHVAPWSRERRRPEINSRGLPLLAMPRQRPSGSSKLREWPTDQFSFAASRTFTNTPSGRMPGLSPSSSAIRRNSAFFCSAVRVLNTVIWMYTTSALRATPYASHSGSFAASCVLAEGSPRRDDAGPCHSDAGVQRGSLYNAYSAGLPDNAHRARCGYFEQSSAPALAKSAQPT